MPTRAFAGNHRGASQQDSKRQDVAPPPPKTEAKVVAISYVPELDDLSEVSDTKVRRGKSRVPTEERPVRNFDAIVAEREAARKATKERARGKTLPGERRRPSAGDTAFQDDDDELTVFSSVGVGRFTRALTETRDAVFHRDPPKIEIFTYRSHEQVAEVQEPVAWTNFEGTRGDHKAWKAARDRFFKYGIIGASRDNPAIFFDEQAQKEDAQRKKLQGMSAKERRLSRLSTVPCVLPPVQPVFPQHDTSFLQPGCLAKATARHVPSIFNEHPLEEFVRFGGRPPTGSLFPPLVQSKAEGLGKENADVVREEIKERKEENGVEVCAEIKESKSKKGIAGKEDWEGEECKEGEEDGEGQEGQECEERNADNNEGDEGGEGEGGEEDEEHE